MIFVQKARNHTRNRKSKWLIVASKYTALMGDTPVTMIARMDDAIDAKKILFALPPEGWIRPPGRRRIKAQDCTTFY